MVLLGSSRAPILANFLFIHAETTRLLDHNAPKLYVSLDYVQHLHNEVLHFSCPMFESKYEYAQGPNGGTLAI